MNMRTAIVVGATGLTGQALLKELCEREEYVSITAIVRRALAFEHPKLEVLVKSFDEIEEADLPPVHDVFCCLGTTQKKAGSKQQFERVDFEYPMRIASLAKKKGIPHFCVISAMGASEKSRFYYSQVKGKLEAELTALSLERLTIVRPSLLTGDRSEFRLGEKAGEFALRIGNPLLVGAMRKYRSISATQLAIAMVCIALYEQPKKVRIYESAQLNQFAYPLAEIEQDISFDWSKHQQGEDDAPVDEDIVFDRTKLKKLDDE